MGKQEKLSSISDGRGHFFLLAIDQRGSLRKMLARRLKSDPSSVSSDHLIRVKELIIKVLSPHTTGVLTDPQYGYPVVTKAIKKGRGFLLSVEESGSTSIVIQGQPEQRARLSGWTPEQIARAGASGVKLLLPYWSKASQETKTFQKNIAISIGQQSVVAGMPFVLEILSYPQTSAETVLEAASEFTQDDYHVDVLKLEHPGSLEDCRKITQTVTKPWVMLSAGVPFVEFYRQMKDGFAGGAAGFLVGRAVWQDAIPFYNPTDKKLTKMRKWLELEGVKRLVKLRELVI